MVSEITSTSTKSRNNSARLAKKEFTLVYYPRFWGLGMACHVKSCHVKLSLRSN